MRVCLPVALIEPVAVDAEEVDGESLGRADPGAGGYSTLRWAFGVQQPLKAAQPAQRSGGWIATASKGETASSGPRISRLPMIATRCGEACGTA